MQKLSHTALARTHSSCFVSFPDVISQVSGFSLPHSPLGWLETPPCFSTGFTSSSTPLHAGAARQLALTLDPEGSIAQLTPAALLAHFDLSYLAHRFKKQLSGNEALLVYLTRQNSVHK